MQHRNSVNLSLVAGQKPLKGSLPASLVQIQIQIQIETKAVSEPNSVLAGYLKIEEREMTLLGKIDYLAMVPGEDLVLGGDPKLPFPKVRHRLQIQTIPKNCGLWNCVPFE